MAGDWIHYAKDLPEKPEILNIVALTGWNVFEVCGRLMAFWAWADGQSIDGVLCPQAVRILSARHADADGRLCAAMCAVGWLVESDGKLNIPNFEVWLGRSAKRRLQEARRKQQSRQNQAEMSAKRPHRVRTKSGHDADEKRPREEKRREEINTPFPPSLNTTEFAQAWERWALHRRQLRKKITPLTASRQLAQLAAWGPVKAVASIDASITNGWTGLFEPDPPKPGHPAGPVLTAAERIAKAQAEKAARMARTEAGALPPEELRRRLAEGIGRLPPKTAPPAAPRDAPGSDSPSGAPDDLARPS